MARVDLTSSAARGRVLEPIEEQLALLTERQAAVEARLQQIRSVIFRRYREGVGRPGPAGLSPAAQPPGGVTRDL